MIKAYFDTKAVTIRLGSIFSHFGLSPNLWTILALVPAVLGFIALYKKYLLLGLVLFVISGLVDAIDGAIARVTNSVSSLGAFLDGVIDRYIEMALYVGLMFYLWDERLLFSSQLWILLLLYGALMPTFVRAYADHCGVVTDLEKLRRMGGPIERFERLTLLYVGMLLGLWDVHLLISMVAVTAVLSNYTALLRIHYVVKEANSSNATL